MCDDADGGCLPLAAFVQSALEPRLSQLFKHLHGMRQTLGLLLAPGPYPSDPAQRLLPPAVYARLLNQADQCSGLLESCCSDILTLSLILPSALWVSRASSFYFICVQVSLRLHSCTAVEL